MTGMPQQGWYAAGYRGLWGGCLGSAQPWRACVSPTMGSGPLPTLWLPPTLTACSAPGQEAHAVREPD